jgi:hypothetical protein
MKTDIQRTMEVVIEEITKDRMEVDSKKVKAAWRDYVQYWPDCGTAMIGLQRHLLKDAKEEKDMITMGQYMENLSWSLRKEL